MHRYGILLITLYIQITGKGDCYEQTCYRVFWI